MKLILLVVFSFVKYSLNFIKKILYFLVLHFPFFS